MYSVLSISVLIYMGHYIFYKTSDVTYSITLLSNNIIASLFISIMTKHVLKWTDFFHDEVNILNPINLLYRWRRHIQRQHPEQKWTVRNEWGFRPPLCTYKLNWARRTSWGWWDEWDDTALQKQYSNFKLWRSEAELATSRSRRLPTILNLYKWAGKKHFVSLKLECQRGVRSRDLRLSKQAALTTTPGPPP